MTTPMPADVAAVFTGLPPVLRDVRALIFETADALEVGPLTEALRWGEPAYLTDSTKAGSTVRLGVKEGQAVVFFICHTGLLDGFRSDFPELPTLGNRGIIVEDGFDRAALALCLSRALTYHRTKREVRA